MRMPTRIVAALGPLAVIAGVVTALTVNVGPDSGTAAADVSATTDAATSAVTAPTTSSPRPSTTAALPSIVVTSTKSPVAFSDTTRYDDARVGQCFDLAPDATLGYTETIVSCDGPHGYELLLNQPIDQSVVAFGDVPAEVERVCRGQFSLKAVREAQVKLTLWRRWPAESTWPDDRGMQCVAAAPDDMEWIGDALIVSSNSSAPTSSAGP